MNDQRLAELAEHFRTNTFERLEQMRALLARLAADPTNAETMTLIHRHFHGLSGLGGTYGFPRVSEIAGKVEDDCDALEGALPLEASFVRHLEEAIATIEAEVRRR